MYSVIIKKKYCSPTFTTTPINPVVGLDRAILRAVQPSYALRTFHSFRVDICVCAH